jgi:hypothetical protein
MVNERIRRVASALLYLEVAISTENRFSAASKLPLHILKSIRYLHRLLPQTSFYKLILDIQTLVHQYRSRIPSELESSNQHHRRCVRQERANCTLILPHVGAVSTPHSNIAPTYPFHNPIHIQSVVCTTFSAKSSLPNGLRRCLP